MVLSIILPVYNVGPYIERCLESLVKQDLGYDRYEIIAVNDGSTDNSRDIIVKYKNKYSNVFLIDQENQGVSAARNAGIAAARGEYILFIDPDDYIVKNSLKYVCEKASEFDLEVFYLGFEYWDPSKKYKVEIKNYELNDKTVTGTEAYWFTRKKQKTGGDRPVGILFKNSFFNKHKLFFTPNIHYLEDGHFVGKVLCKATRCGFDDNPFYKCEKREGSASTATKYYEPKILDGFLIAAADLTRFKKETKSNFEQTELINHLIAKFVLSSVMFAATSKNYKIINKTKHDLNKLGLNKIAISKRSQLKLYSLVYNLSYWGYILYFITESRMKKYLFKKETSKKTT